MSRGGGLAVKVEVPQTPSWGWGAPHWAGAPNGGGCGVCAQNSPGKPRGSLNPELSRSWKKMGALPEMGPPGASSLPHSDQGCPKGKTERACRPRPSHTHTPARLLG